ncbi:MAG: KilA-N domain-containing protein [Acinetobacter sp.]|nr:KilA-N domain-containing protein [Acinetobacter sp.]MDN5511166.1 KilA-N domain-containing protein [Acinetobacter sp.]MDN5523941.1 KilA-N domain-containing protein [Acinetobacter sp.]
MKSTNNKKAQTFDGKGLIDVITKEVNNMNIIQQNLLNPNTQPLVIGEFSIRQDEDGRYCINDLHKASGGAEKHKPFNFMRNQQTKDLILEIEQENMMLKSEHHKIEAVNTIKGRGLNQGTFVIKELVYHYAMWISAKFHLMVIRAYDAMVMEWMIGGKQTISPEQCGILYNIVHTRANGNQGLIKQMWSRLKNHFKYSASYRELRAIHFEDAKHYLELMDLKINSKQPEVKALPYPQEVVQVAQQINNEFNGGKYDSWFVNARDGMLSVMPLPHGYYPFNVKEFTKHFDGVLNTLYGSDVLQIGRYMQRQG